MDLSIIIVNWNTREVTRNCLASIKEHVQGMDYETILVDNGSSDGSIDMVRQEFPWVTLICNEQNHGFAYANNQGIELAKGRYLLFLNSDTIVLGGTFDKILAFADQHPEAGIIGCKVLNSDMTLQPTCFMYPSTLNIILSTTYLYKLFPRSKFFGRERMSWWDRSDVREVKTVTGCFMLARKDLVDQIGGMDTSFFMYAEESDWCFRIHKAGWKNLFTPIPGIIHLGGVSTSRVSNKMLIQLWKSKLQFILKHGTRHGYYASAIFIWLFFVLRIPIWMIHFMVIPSKRSLSREMIVAYNQASFYFFKHCFKKQ